MKRGTWRSGVLVGLDGVALGFAAGFVLGLVGALLLVVVLS